MALPPQELRYRKFVFYISIGVCCIMAIAMPVSLLSTDLGPSRWPAYLACGIALLTFAGIIYFMVKRIQNNDPALTFMSHGLHFNKGDRTILWGDITEWTIKRYKSNYRLIIRTANGKQSMDITWLDRDHKAIRSMMETYIKEPGPGGVKR